MSKGKTPTRRVVTTKKTSQKKAEEKVSFTSKVAEPSELPFGRMNYILLLIGVGIIALGFILMSLDDFVDATEFSISLYIAPVVVVAGFVEIIYAIMYRPSDNSPKLTEE